MDSDNEMTHEHSTAVPGCIKSFKGTKDRSKWRLPCFANFGQDKTKLIISDSQLKVRNMTMASKVPADSVLISMPGASTSDLIWLLSVGRVTKRGEENLIFSHDSKSNPLPSEQEMALTNNKFLDHAAFLTQNFTQYRCVSCRLNCYTNKKIIINIGINDFLYHKNGSYTNALKSIANLKTISKLLSNMSLSQFYFIHLPKIRCPIIKAQPKLYKKILLDISEFNKQIIKIHAKNNSQNFTFSELHLQFRPDLIHFTENLVIDIYTKIASL